MQGSNAAAELERFKTEINLSHYAAALGYELDRRETSRNSAVMRHANGDKIVIAKDGAHWIYFSVRDDGDHGSIIDFVMRRQTGGMGAARQTLRGWINSPPPPPPPTHYAADLATSTRDRAGVMRRFLQMAI